MKVSVNELRTIPLFEGMAEEEMGWLVENSEQRYLQEGEYFYRENQALSEFYVVLEGELQISRTWGDAHRVLGTTPRGIMAGEYALLTDTPSLVDAQAIVPSRVLVLDEDAFRRLFGACPTLGRRILQTSAERMVGSATMVKDDEKMTALGKLAAGLAHELNNPASAARRASALLQEALPTLQARTMALNALNLSQAQQQSLLALQRDAPGQTAGAKPLSPLEQADREDQLCDWLNGLGEAEGWEMAANFVKADLTLADLQELATDLPPGSETTALHWLDSALYAASLLQEIEGSTTRVSELVTAVKSYTFMDQAPIQRMDINQGLDDTLMVMSHKLRDIDVNRAYDPELPSITANGSQLNQVWTHLIDNAVDAMAGRGELTIITRNENDFVMVEVKDNGPGIPADAQERIFEPFFSTKDVGAGTGLGLDITYRIVKQHKGTIEFHSKPGQTRFIVRLPTQAKL
jgi:signal transduction histidine kinase